MYDSITIANYILWRAKRADQPVLNQCHLQRLLFFTDMAYLIDHKVHL